MTLGRLEPDVQAPAKAGAYLLALIAVVLLTSPAAAQVRGGVEAVRERVTHHFDHPSSIDTVELVPHYFEQHYVLDNVWLTGTVSYTAGLDWETSAGVTPTQTALATDYDWFYNPGGVVWVAGTTGDARVRSWRFGQQARIGRAGPLLFTAGYRLRVDSADFLEGDKTIVRNGVLVSQEIVTTREYTSAHRHEIFAGTRFTRILNPRWQFSAGGDIAPITINRLAVELPDKYPGLTIVYRTTTLTATGTMEVARTGTRWPIAVGIQAVGTASYSADQHVSRTLLGASVTVGRTW